MDLSNKKVTRVGVVGTGFIAKGYVLACLKETDIAVSKILTRRSLSSLKDFPDAEKITNSINDLLDNCDIVLECSGDVVHATQVVDLAFKASLPVVTMNAEFHVTTGSYFVDKGLLSEAEGDQPGCTAALQRDAEQMGFKTWVYGNVKGYSELNPSIENMQYWSKKQGLSLGMVTASTDGTKLQFEQALMANFYGAGIAKEGLTGIKSDDFRSSALMLGDIAKEYGSPISDYVIVASNLSSVRVFLVAEHEDYNKDVLSYMKMGEGPMYLIEHGRNLCHFEINKTVRQIRDRGEVLLSNGVSPTISVAAIAKKDIASGTAINNGCGSFEMRGTSVRIKDNRNHVPIALMHNAHIVRPVEEGQILTWDDVEIKPSLAYDAWRSVEASAGGWG